MFPAGLRRDIVPASLTPLVIILGQTELVLKDCQNPPNLRDLDASLILEFSINSSAGLVSFAL
jgi:hypothetical protein